MAEAGNIEDKLADAALKLLAKKSWRDLTLADVAKTAKVPLAQLQELRGGKSALVGAILEKIGAETAKRYKAESDTARERLFDVALAWFEVNAKRKPAIGALYEGLKYDPITLISERAEIAAAANWLMTLAQADTGPAVQARAVGLVAIIAHTIPVWLEDDAEMAATMARLDTDLSRADGFLKRRSAKPAT
jgi:AcrR family transcriptional regulator